MKTQYQHKSDIDITSFSGIRGGAERHTGTGQFREEGLSHAWVSRSPNVSVTLHALSHQLSFSHYVGSDSRQLIVTGKSDNNIPYEA